MAFLQLCTKKFRVSKSVVPPTLAVIIRKGMHQGSYMCSCLGVGINVGQEMDISIFAGEPNLPHI